MQIDRTSIVLVAIASVLVRLIWRAQRAASRVRVHLVTDTVGNEALVLSGTFAGDRRGLFMIDTAYAGAPVLSTSYLATRCDSRSFATVQERYRTCVGEVRTKVTEEERHRSVAQLIAAGNCRAFTSGCTMRLMSIGTTSEAQSDMLLCPSLRFDGARAGDMVDADVMVTHSLPGSVHILTIDYLLHRAPCLILPRKGSFYLKLSPTNRVRFRPTFEFHPVQLVGGAMAIEMLVGGAPMWIVVDTGAAAALSISEDARARMQRQQETGMRAFQSGVNGERVCSNAMHSDVAIGSIRFDDIEVFANVGGVEEADGYAGMGLLRALDLWLEPGTIGLRLSGLKPQASTATSAGTCNDQ